MSNDSRKKVNSYLSFQIGTEIFAANVTSILNILEMTKITRVPKSPVFMKGVMNLRGSVLPVLDTRIKFGLPETEYTTNTCILVLEILSKNETIQMGAIVDNVQEVLELSDDEIQPPPSIGTNYRSDFLVGMASKNNNFIMIIDVNEVFADYDIINIQELSAESKISTE
jgi:purine-binding chemotaxis protein CheW